MIFTVEIEYSDGCILEWVSNSLNDCIEHINNHDKFPMLGNYVVFSVWNNGCISKYKFNGYRSNALIDIEKDRKFTFEEVMKKL